MPANITKPFLWRTSVINKDIDLPYKEEYVEDKRLLGQTQDVKYRKFDKLKSDRAVAMQIPYVDKNLEMGIYRNQYQCRLLVN